MIRLRENVALSVANDYNLVVSDNNKNKRRRENNDFVAENADDTETRRPVVPFSL